MSSTTRDRIVDEAMLLFSRHGYRGTSIAKIEAAVGLTPGAGGLYHHFDSKQAVLAAGIERQLARLDALRDIRRALTPLGDLRSELVLIARYALAELDAEADLLRILASESRSQPQLLRAAADRLIGSAFDDFATWIGERAPRSLAPKEAAAIAALGLGSLFASRLLRDVLGVPAQVDDEMLVETWTRLVAAALSED